MKELNKFRQFINEGKENVDELFGLRGKPDSTKKAAKALDALEKALFELNFLDILGQEDYEDWLIKYEELRGRVMAGLEDSDRKKYDVAYGSSEGDLDENDAAEGQIHEGTWGYGSKNQMLKALDKLNKIGQMGGVKGSVELSKIDDILYNVFGNDDFHDSIDQAKDNAIDDDRFANYIGDAQAKGMKMLNDIYSDKGANAFTKADDNPDVVGRDMMAEEDLSENDKSLDEIIDEGK